MRATTLILALAIAALAIPSASAHIAPCVGGLPCSADDCTADDPGLPATVHVHGPTADGGFCVGASVPCPTTETCGLLSTILTLLLPIVGPLLPR